MNVTSNPDRLDMTAGWFIVATRRLPTTEYVFPYIEERNSRNVASAAAHRLAKALEQRGTACSIHERTNHVPRT